MPDELLDSPTTNAPPAPKPDRTVAVLAWAAGVVALLVFTALVYILVVGLTPTAPRTATELRLMTLERQVQIDPRNAQIVAQYAQALTDSGQFSKARSVIEDGRSRIGNVSALTLEEGRLLVEQQRLTEAITTLTEAVREARAERTKKEQDFAAKGVQRKVDSPELVAAELLLARVYTVQGKWGPAVDAYGLTLKEDPTMADVLVRRAAIYAKMKRPEDARRDYAAALKYIPGYQPALKGLADLKAVGK